MIEYVDQVYLQHGASDTVYGQNEEEFETMRLHMARANLKLLPARIRHMGTDNTLKVLQNLKTELDPHITIKTGEAVESILVERHRRKGYGPNAAAIMPPHHLRAWPRWGAMVFRADVETENSAQQQPG